MTFIIFVFEFMLLLFIFIVVAHPDDRMVRLQAEQESGQLAGLLVGGVRGAGSGIMDRVLASRAFRVAYGSGSAADRDLGPSAIHE